MKPQAKFRKDYKAPAFTIETLHLTFKLHETATEVQALSTFKATEPHATTLELDGIGLTLVSLKVDGVAHNSYTINEEKLSISDLPAEGTLEIINTINPKENTQLEGLYLSNGAFCTQCEAEGFRRITWYLDRPDVLAKFTTTIIAPKEQYPYLLSNGNRIHEEDLPDGMHMVTWEDPFPKPSYLFALVAGDFDLLKDSYTTGSGREVLLELFVDKGNLHRADHAMHSLKNAMKWDEERFGLEYDLDIYMIVAVGFFNMGAMENKGLNVFNDKYVLANPETATDTDYLHIEGVIGHEYFHNWTGNRVTCRDWFQLSLKEGLTVFRDQEFSSDLGSRAVNRINNVRLVRNHQFAEDAGPMSHPIRPEKVIEMNNFYTVTIYEKGSEVIRMMHTILGEEKFQKGMQLYFERHDGSAATCEDFVSAMEDASGISLKQFRLWYSQSGTPVLTITDHFDTEAKTFSVTIQQETKPTHDQLKKEPLHIPVRYELLTSAGETIANSEFTDNILHVTKETETFVFHNVAKRPVLSLLQEFSAPVKLEYDYRDEELALLMVHASNAFARWDAGQMLLAKHIKSFITAFRHGETYSFPDSLSTAFRNILLNREQDPALTAELFTLPAESEIAGWYTIADVDAIHAAHTALRDFFVQNLYKDFLARYNELKQQTYTIDHKSIAERTLKNSCLHYLAFTAQGEELVEKQYHSSTNMTDTTAALASATDAELSIRAELMVDFSDKWSEDGLVMDKWFVLQGGSPAENVLEMVKDSMEHSAFSMKNPNRIRSLIGTFASRNQYGFHKRDGSGYQFIAEQIKELNSSNPQVAARMIDPLIKYKHFDEHRAALMKKELEAIAKLPDLAKDLFEKVTKALEG